MFLTSIFLCLSTDAASADNERFIHIHYLGHTGIIMQFGNGIGIVTDHAAFHNIANFKPDVATYAHGHDDHAGGFMRKDTRNVLSRSMSLEIDGITIHPILGKIC